jgi:hypothetical protein
MSDGLIARTHVHSIFVECSFVLQGDAHYILLIIVAFPFILQGDAPRISLIFL